MADFPTSEHLPFRDNRTALVREPRSTPSDGDFSAQHTQQEASPSWPRRSLSANSPWTPLNTRYLQDYQPGPDELMIAPGDTFDTPAPRVDESVEFQSREAYVGQQADGYLSRGFIEDEDTIDEPPSNDPIGPPIGSVVNPPLGPEQPQKPKNLGRRGKLDDSTAEHAKIMRVKGACWRCRLLRYKVRYWQVSLNAERSRHEPV